MSATPSFSTDSLVSTFERASSADSESPEKSVKAAEPPKSTKNQPASTKNSKKQKIEEKPVRRNKIERVLSKPATKDGGKPNEKQPGPSSSRDSDFELAELRNAIEKEEEEEETEEIDPFELWTVADDVALLTTVAHVSCLRFTFNCLRFSRDFTYAQLEERYKGLMFDKAISSRAQERFDAMPDLQMLQVQSRIPFTRSEEKCLVEKAEQILYQMVPSKKGDKSESVSHTMLRIEHFKRILDANRALFHPARTPQVLSDQFRRIKSYREQPADDKAGKEKFVEQSGAARDDIDIIERLEACSARFQSIKDNPILNGILNSFKTSIVPDNAIAMIHGRFLQFAMIGNTVTLGRASLNEKVDVDLSIEGPAAKVSRQQAKIRLNEDGEFTIENIGQRPISVDGKPLVQGVITSLTHGSIIQVATITLIFSIPVPRTMHPITRQVAMQQHKAAEAAQRPTYQSFQKPPVQANAKKGRPVGSGGGGSRPSTSSGASMHSVVRRADPIEKERLLKAVAGIGQ